jgi:crotonobetainyl-CoA:carnitine CoA-transferase CaiB-like acyl-CoA transferase
MCHITAGPTITRILGEYGADVIKVTGPGLIYVLYFQVEGNMAKHIAELGLKAPEVQRF